MADDVSIDIRINDPAWNAWPDDLTGFVGSVIDTAKRYTKSGQFDLLLTNDEEIRVLNRDWRDKDKPTDVLSFPSDDIAFDAGFLGDIAISHGVLARDAEEMGKTLKAHFSHLLVHGYLHLLGYDHHTDDEAAEMEGLERKILADLGLPDPYSVEISK